MLVYVVRKSEQSMLSYEFISVLKVVLFENS